MLPNLAPDDSPSDTSEPELDADAYSPSPSPFPLPGHRRTSHGRKRGEGHVRRPANAFIQFRMDLCRKEKVKPTVERDHRNISRIAGHLWRNLTPEQQLPYHKLAEQAKRKHALLYPNYKYTPVYNRDRAAKSKDKGDHARRALIAEKERRSQAIAGLIEQGFEGDDLERELGKRKADQRDEGESDDEYVQESRRKKPRKSSKAPAAKKKPTARPSRRTKTVKVEQKVEAGTASAEPSTSSCTVVSAAIPPPPAEEHCAASRAPPSPETEVNDFVLTSDIPDLCLPEPAYNHYEVRNCHDLLEVY